MPLEDKFDTFGSHMDRALYGPLGYYSSGTVKFITSLEEEGDFRTHATQGRGLAFVLVNYLHTVFSHQLNNKVRDASNPSPFIVTELSGGNGQLAHDILHLIKKLAEAKYEKFPQLWQSMQYVTYELSPALAAKQVSLNKEFVDAKKYSVNNTSAQNIKENKVDFCFSNEFWDALPFENFKKKKDGLFIEVCVPYMKEKEFNKYSGLASEDRELLLKELESFTTLPEVSGRVPLDKKSYEEIVREMNTLTRNKSSTFEWKTMLVPITAYPQLEEKVKKAQAYFDELDKGAIHHVSLDQIEIANNLAAINPYFSIHFDYAGAAKGGSQFAVRYYPVKGPDPFYDFQPNVDITTEADFRALAIQLSNNKLSECVYNYNAAACVIFPELEKTFKILSKDEEITSEDMDNFCYTKANFKFIAHSSKMNVKRLNENDVFVSATQKEDFPDKPYNPINAGIPLDRPYRPQPGHPGCLLNPAADVERVEQFITLYLPKLVGADNSPQEVVDSHAKHDKDRHAKHGKDSHAKHDKDRHAKHDKDRHAKHDKDRHAKHGKDQFDATQRRLSSSQSKTKKDAPLIFSQPKPTPKKEQTSSATTASKPLKSMTRQQRDNNNNILAVEKGTKKFPANARKELAMLPKQDLLDRLASNTLEKEKTVELTPTQKNNYRSRK